MITQIAEATGGSVRQVCRVLNLPRSSFYHAAVPTPTEAADERIGSLIEAIFKLHRRRYGYRRIREELADRGVICAPARIRRIMAQRGLCAIQPKNYLPRTSDGRADKPSPNLLADRPLPDAPNRVWAGDITFIPTESGWLYLAVVIDLCSRRIVGWSLGDHLRTDLVLAALRQALGTQRVRQTIFHSDRGSQYGSSAFRAALAHAGMLQSMSRRANPYDPSLSYFRPLKAVDGSKTVLLFLDYLSLVKNPSEHTWFNHEDYKRYLKETDPRKKRNILNRSHQRSAAAVMLQHKKSLLMALKTAGDARVKEKFRWLIKYHNSSIRGYPRVFRKAVIDMRTLPRSRATSSKNGGQP
ncbi:MAG TPA: IS3 family transposase [Terrimicrobiaceae bacterium]|nr:IS3 family transposase [Terrimicrobiaceae bacterium]